MSTINTDQHSKTDHLVELEILCGENSYSGINAFITPDSQSARYSWNRLASLEVSAPTLSNATDAALALIHYPDNYPALETLYVRSVGIDTPVLPEKINALHDACKKVQVQLYIDIALPENADAMNSLSMENIITASRLLANQTINIRWLVPTIKPLVFKLEGLFSLAHDEGIDALLVPAQRLEQFYKTTAALTDDENLFIWDFITYRLLSTDAVQHHTGRDKYYNTLLDSFSGKSAESLSAVTPWLDLADKTARSSLHQLHGDASIRYISIASASIQSKSGSQIIQTFKKLQEIVAVLAGGIRAYINYFLSTASHTVTQDDSALKNINTVMLIGAYGGEHIGDAAILGGVLLRIHQRYGIKDAVLMTQRVNHTKHLIPMLNVPVNVTVEEYNWSQIRNAIGKVDAVVFAGGPLIDLPKQLIRHLYAVSLARRKNRPFIIEGIGPGPFVRRPSIITARKLVGMASYISLRTTDSAQHEIMKDTRATVGRCPAFDYLESRHSNLDRMPTFENTEIEELLDNTNERIIVGINIRPIGHLYTAGADEEDAAAYTRRIEDRFEQRFAEGLRAFHNSSAIKPCFIFFPMNSIQFGMSDLLSAYRIKRYLDILSKDGKQQSPVDFRVWQADASLDGVVDLIRKLDVAITMRFHATIFALSQHCKVIGVDYRIGKRDKIAELLDDAGMGEYCERIDLLTPDWLLDKLSTLCTDKNSSS